ncbi:hypothetical protein CJF31_00000325 [Rutstroemia sp. NJR-2017a BVV2]|nr:hypothetical protein CJF31_00000325 [Rutstroemia sp. NJR-2017a BVV2]
MCLGFCGGQNTSEPKPEASVKILRAKTNTSNKQGTIAARPRTLHVTNVPPFSPRFEYKRPKLTSYTETPNVTNCLKICTEHWHPRQLICEKQALLANPAPPILHGKQVVRKSTLSTSIHWNYYVDDGSDNGYQLVSIPKTAQTAQATATASSSRPQGKKEA